MCRCPFSIPLVPDQRRNGVRSALYWRLTSIVLVLVLHCIALVPEHCSVNSLVPELVLCRIGALSTSRHYLLHYKLVPYLPRAATCSTYHWSLINRTPLPVPYIIIPLLELHHNLFYVSLISDGHRPQTYSASDLCLIVIATVPVLHCILALLPSHRGFPT